HAVAVLDLVVQEPVPGAVGVLEVALRLLVAVVDVVMIGDPHLGEEASAGLGDAVPARRGGLEKTCLHMLEHVDRGESIEMIVRVVRDAVRRDLAGHGEPRIDLLEALAALDNAAALTGSLEDR